MLKINLYIFILIFTNSLFAKNYIVDGVSTTSHFDNCDQLTFKENVKFASGKKLEINCDKIIFKKNSSLHLSADTSFITNSIEGNINISGTPYERIVSIGDKQITLSHHAPNSYMKKVTRYASQGSHALKHQCKFIPIRGVGIIRYKSCVDKWKKTGGPHGKNGRHGTGGKNGQNGFDGLNGVNISIVTKSFVNVSTIKITSNGTPGQPGEKGQNGQNGGNGGNGLAGNKGKESSTFHRAKKGTTGGNGGDAGDGGNGGDGGDGGNGGSAGQIYFEYKGPKEDYKNIHFDFYSEGRRGGNGGNKGLAGEAGSVGKGGNGGAGGKGRRLRSNGKRGSNGTNGGDGHPGIEGANGSDGTPGKNGSPTIPKILKVFTEIELKEDFAFEIKTKDSNSSELSDQNIKLENSPEDDKNEDSLDSSIKLISRYKLFNECIEILGSESPTCIDINDITSDSLDPSIKPISKIIIYIESMKRCVEILGFEYLLDCDEIYHNFDDVPKL